LDSALRKRLCDAQDACRFLGCFLRATCEIDHYREVYVCMDSRNIPQAVMTLSDENHNIHIHHLVTCPWNICPLEGVQNFPTKGAGTFLMKVAMARAVEQSKSVDLDSYASAETFYKKIGFILKEKQKRGVNTGKSDEKEQVACMILPDFLVRILYSKYIPLIA
jgi:hypothetical protein